MQPHFCGVCRPSFGLWGVKQEPPYGLSGLYGLESGHPWVMKFSISKVKHDLSVMADIHAAGKKNRENICFKAWNRVIEEDLRIEGEIDLTVRTENT